MSVVDRNSVLQRCHQILWGGGALDPLAAWEQLTLILIAWKELKKDSKAFNNPDKINNIQSKIENLLSNELKKYNFSKRNSTDDDIRQILDEIDDISPEELNSGDAKESMLDGFLRHGLGQYFTPLFARTLTVKMIPPKPGMKVGDYCMGPGGYLREATKEENKIVVYGCDISEKLWKQTSAEFNLLSEIKGEFACVNSLLNWNCKEYNDHNWLKPNFLDRAYTNPPFGSDIDTKEILGNFELGKGKKKQTSEALLLERHIDSLVPGGMLGIVLPDSILSNFGNEHVREFILKKTTLRAVISLPTHTFQHSDTCAKASILIIEKQTPPSSHSVFMAKLEDIGYDSRGYSTDSQVDEVLVSWESFVENGHFEENDLVFTKKSTELVDRMVAVRSKEIKLPKNWISKPLSELCLDVLECGRTAGKKDYSNNGCKLLKVRDLSGKGIDWSRDDKGRVSDKFFKKSAKGHLQNGDIVIITAAHHGSYIGKDVDIIENIPDEFSGRLMCTGEIMKIRVNPEIIEPRFVLNWLRTEEGYQVIQDCIRGQTAHLYPRDVCKIKIPYPPNDKEMKRFQQIFDLEADAQSRKFNAERDLEESLQLFFDEWGT